MVRTILAYSAKTASREAHSPDVVKPMTVAQQERMHNAFKKWVIRRFKEGEAKGLVYDGSGFFGQNVFVAQWAFFYDSEEYLAPSFMSKGILYAPRFSDDDRRAIIKKAKTLLTKAGYKCQLNASGNKLSVWKVRKKKK